MLREAIAIVGGYLGGKVLWAVIVTLHVGRLPPFGSSPEVNAIFDLGTAISAIGVLCVVAWFHPKSSREA